MSWNNYEGSKVIKVDDWQWYVVRKSYNTHHRTNMNRIVLLHGYKGCGKDTMCNMIQAHRPNTYKQISFAQPLKDVCKIMFDLNYEREYKDTIDTRWNRTPRQILQYVGTEIVRDKLHKDLNLDKSLWITILCNKIRSEPMNNYIITDCRFYDELESIKQLATELNVELITIKIIPSNFPIIEPRDKHISEQGIINTEFDITYYNEYGKLDNMMKFIDKIGL